MFASTVTNASKSKTKVSMLQWHPKVSANANYDDMSNKAEGIEDCNSRI